MSGVLLVGTIRRGGHPVVGFGDVTQVVSQADVWNSASVAITALRADPNYCKTVAQAGTPTNEAVLNFKRAWNAQSGTKPIPSGPSYESETASAIQQVLGGVAFVPACASPAIVSKVSNAEVGAIAIGISTLTVGGLGYVVGLAAKRPRTGAVLGGVLGGAFMSVGVVNFMRSKP